LKFKFKLFFRISLRPKGGVIPPAL
jgi:hypothetical protein